ncbi:MAG: M15 family metallopeptidase [Candidatus Methylacidiphilales bacterium]|nr:M15 family metallopeptidase [Candidatus Methylacidiphilales bacterium]
MSIQKALLAAVVLATGGGVFLQGAELVDLAEAIPGIRLDMRYAGPHNITGRAIYSDPRARLRPEAAARLKRVQERLRRDGLQLVIWDAYRPQWAQEALWKAVPNANFVAPPRMGSRHTRGTSVDVGLADLQGNPVAVPTDHDVFSPLADHDFRDLPKAAAAHAEKLRQAMFQNGWSGVPAEWWHYDLRNWREFPPIKDSREQD